MPELQPETVAAQLEGHEKVCIERHRNLHKRIDSLSRMQKITLWLLGGLLAKEVTGADGDMLRALLGFLVP